MRCGLINSKLSSMGRRKIFLFFIVILFTFFCNISLFASESSDPSKFPIYVAVFFEPGCHDCEKAEKMLEKLTKEYPDTLFIKRFDISLVENMELAESLGEIYHMPEEERLLVPVIFLGDEYLFRQDITQENMISLIQKYKDVEIIPPWEKIEKDNSQNRLVNRFQSFGLFAVAFSGLIDGINPCAFATIIFFISYLTLINRKGKDLLWVGGMFTFAVFLTYFLIGTGALKIITSLSFLPLARKIFSIVTAVIAIILGIISLQDYLRFKASGETKDAKLQLSPFLKKMIHSTIRKNVKLGNYILMAAVTGFIVSLLELACTGQIYLPTIMFISTIPKLKVNALMYLLFYNLMFVLPLIFVFSLTYWGTSSQQIGALTQKNFGIIKLAMTFLFFGLAGLLIFTGVLI